MRRTGPVKPPKLGVSSAEVWRRALTVVLLLFIFLVGIKGLSTGFMALGKDLLDSFFAATSNPFVGLVIGILGTTLVQSSSVTTSMIVALVAAPDNPLPLSDAVPMIMGANIGTTVTNTIVSLGHINRPAEFHRAFAASTCHDFFNFITVSVLLPLELATGYLRKTAGWVVGFVGEMGGGKLPNPLSVGIKAIVEPIKSLVFSVSDSQIIGAVLLLLVSATIIVVSLAYIVKNMRALTQTRMEQYISRFLDSNAYLGIFVGVVVTIMVQSSSITTSLLVPLAGAGVITLRQVFPITLGANIGTTVTAMLASLAAAGGNTSAAVQIALVHLFFNLSGIVLIYPLEVTRRIPLRLAQWLAATAVRSKKFALLYVVSLFYLIPAALVALGQLF